MADKFAKPHDVDRIMAQFGRVDHLKTAACAYLLDKWFDGEKSTWECAR